MISMLAASTGSSRAAHDHPARARSLMRAARSCPDMQRVSVIINAYTAGRFDDLIEAIGAVGAQTHRAVELIVVIDGDPPARRIAACTCGRIDDR